MELKEIELRNMDWINLVYSRDQWKVYIYFFVYCKLQSTQLDKRLM